MIPQNGYSLFVFRRLIRFEIRDPLERFRILFVFFRSCFFAHLPPNKEFFLYLEAKTVL
jgi:hypothetical protein